MAQMLKDPMRFMKPGLASARARLVSVLVMLAALVGGLWGQWSLDHRPPGPTSRATLFGWGLLLTGALVFALLSRRERLERGREEPGSAVAPDLPLLVGAVVLAVLAFPGFAGNRFRLAPTIGWLASLGLLYLAFRDPASARASRQGKRAAGGAAAEAAARDLDAQQATRNTQYAIRLSWHALALIGIVLVGAVLRLHELDAIPREMGVDMPLKYENALEIMQGRFMIFCPRYPGRESLFFYLIAAYGRLFGLGYFAIKFTSVWIGLATIPAIYAVAKYLFDREVALVAAAFLAVSKWHVILSRTGYRSIMVPLFVAVLIYLTVRALRRGRSADFCVAGMWLGLGMYTYNSWLVVPGVLGAALAVELILAGRRSLKRYAWGLLALVLGALLVFAPLGRYALESPQNYAFRVATRMTGVEAPLPKDVVRVFADNVWRAAGMFNLRGDIVFYQNIPHQRHLGAISGVLFLFGVACALWRWRRGHNAMVLIFLGGMILPTALSVAFPQEVPNAGRASGAILPAYLLMAVPLPLLRRQIAGIWHEGIRQRWFAALMLPPRLRWRWHGQVVLGVGLASALAIAVMVGAELKETWRAYFQDYVSHIPQHNYAISLELARILDDYAGEGPVYIKYVPHWFDGNALRAQLRVMPKTWSGEITELDPSKPPLATAKGKILIIVHPQDQQALETLRGFFPRGVAVNHRDYDGRVAFITFYGER